MALFIATPGCSLFGALLLVLYFTENTSGRGDEMKRIGIRKAIETRIYAMKPNERIASRNAMCMQYSASRSTIDSIMSDLMEAAILPAVKGRRF